MSGSPFPSIDNTQLKALSKISYIFGHATAPVYAAQLPRVSKPPNTSAQFPRVLEGSKTSMQFPRCRFQQLSIHLHTMKLQRCQRRKNCRQTQNIIKLCIKGESGIRTHGILTNSSDFKSDAIDQLCHLAKRLVLKLILDIN